ncbi:MAG TPA: flagellar protein FlaG, partial [Miltoncostaeaceae bacterium]|nr:flagellar protein FlaG [Miltoncostaeaceae bacterium]
AREAAPAPGQEAARRAAEEAATTVRRPPVRPPSSGEAPGVPMEERPLRSFLTDLLEAAGERSGRLKFDVVAADVLARFQVDEETNRVKITMYQRDTGEVIRELPPRGVLDVIRALEHGGLAVDVVS